MERRASQYLDSVDGAVKENWIDLKSTAVVDITVADDFVAATWHSVAAFVAVGGLL